jgi:hypothetical protein
MPMNRILFVVVAALAAPGAMAQQMFKVVGPDGKVTFSDRPALHTPGKVSVMQSYTLRPYVSQRSAAEAAAAAAVKKAAAEVPAAAGMPVAAPAITPEVEDAIVTVMGQVEFARRFYNFCNSTPAGAKAFNTATNAWKQRNAAAIAHQNRLVMESVSPAKRDELQGKVAALLTEEGAKVAARNPKERQAWCAGAIAELESGKADILQPAMMALPIVPYRNK